MNNETAILIAEIPAVTAIAAALVAWFVKRLVTRVDVLQRDTTRHDTAIAGHELRLVAVEHDTANHERRLPILSENLAVLAAFVERHERWHERSDSPAHGAGQA